MLKIFEKPNHNRAFHDCMEHWAKSNLDIDKWFYAKKLEIQWHGDEIGQFILVPDEIAPDFFIKDGPAIPTLMKDKTVPEGVLYLTAAVDVQQGSRHDKNNPPRLEMEMEVLGHGARRRTWSIAYERFEGPVKAAKIDFQTYWYFLWTYQKKYAQTYHLNIAFDDINNTLHVCRWRDQGYTPAGDFLSFIYEEYGLHAINTFHKL